MCLLITSSSMDSTYTLICNAAGLKSRNQISQIPLLVDFQLGSASGRYNWEIGRPEERGRDFLLLCTFLQMATTVSTFDPTPVSCHFLEAPSPATQGPLSSLSARYMMVLQQPSNQDGGSSSAVPSSGYSSFLCYPQP